jgi:large subunit ribosomal protein L4
VTSVDVIDVKGGKAGSVDLPAEIFDTQVNVPLIHQVVVAQLAAARTGTANTKSRGEVAGGGRKPYRQKGTGRARQGSIRSPQFAGGGVVHGPTPRRFDQRTPKKMKAAALRGALSDRARAGRVHVVESLVTGDKPSTKAARGMLRSLTDRTRALVVLDRSDELGWLSVRNLQSVHVLTVDQLNTYDVLVSDDVVFTKAAFDAFVAGRPKGRSVKATATSSEVESESEDEVGSSSTDEASYGADSARPDADGNAPAGFEIKGNETSKKYHLPDSRWYDSTDADVWFRTEDAAKAAGFVKAGSKAKEDDE